MCVYPPGIIQKVAPLTLWVDWKTGISWPAECVLGRLVDSDRGGKVVGRRVREDGGKETGTNHIPGTKVFCFQSPPTRLLYCMNLEEFLMNTRIY